MSLQYRKFLTYTHVLLAAFFLPVAIIFNVTGGLNLYGYHGKKATKQSYELNLNSTETLQVSELQSIANAYLVEQNIKPISGKPNKSRNKKSHVWRNDHRRMVEIKPNYNKSSADLTITRYGIYQRYMNAHKGHAGKTFNIISIGWAIGILILIITGVLIAVSNRNYRKWALLSMVLGVASVAVTVM